MGNRKLSRANRNVDSLEGAMSTQDMTEIEVTMEHIVRGEVAAATLCPVALAIREATGAGTVYVGHRHIR